MYQPSIDSIDAHLPTIADSAEFIKGVHGGLVSNHENLTSQIQQLVGSWNSNASMSFQQAHQEWNDAAEAIHEVLRNLHVALGNVHDNYAATDTTLAKNVWMA